MRMIDERPAEVDDRVQAGHWEGDLIMGAGNRSAIGTLVERTTRYLVLLPFPDGIATTDGVRQAITDSLESVPVGLKRTLTWDQGKELALHQQITVRTGTSVFFCDAHSPWQRGSNENMNGLLRDYFPKGTDLSVHTPADIARVAAEVNDRPRKTLGWQRPADAVRQRDRDRERVIQQVAGEGAHRDAVRLGPPGLRLTASRSLRSTTTTALDPRMTESICCDVGWLSHHHTGASASHHFHLTTSMPFRAGPPGHLSGRLSETTTLEGTAIMSRFPAAFPLPAFASGHPVSAGGLGLPYGRLTGPGPDPDGVSTLRTLKTRPGRAPSIARGWWCSSRPTTSIGLHPAHHNAMSRNRATTTHLCAAPLDEPSTRVQAIHRVSPAHRCAGLPSEPD